MSDQARLCQWVQGVRFCVNHCGRPVEALVLRDALQCCFGAGDEPDGWMLAYGRHRETLHRAARLAHCERPTAPMVVLSACDVESCIGAAFA